MIENIVGISIKGGCFDGASDMEVFCDEKIQLSIVYGKNGSGKSTIAKGFEFIKNGYSEQVEARLLLHKDDEFLNGKDININVFNERFVDNNIKISDKSLHSIVLIGEQVELDNKIDEKRRKINALTEKLELYQGNLDKLIDNNYVESPSYIGRQIIQLLKSGWAERQGNIRQSKIKAPVNFNLIDRIGALNVSSDSGALEKMYDEKMDLLSKITNPPDVLNKVISQVEIDADFDVSLVKLLKTKFQEGELTVREKEMLCAVKNGYQQLLEKSRQEFSKTDVDICPFCYQKITSEYKKCLVASIDRIFNRETIEYKKLLNIICFPTINVDFNEIGKIDGALSININDQYNKCCEIVDYYKNKINKRINDLYRESDIENKNIVEEVYKLNALLREVEDKRRDIISGIGRKQFAQEELSKINDAMARCEINELYEQFIEQTNKKNKLEDTVNKIRIEIDSANNDIDKLQQQKENKTIAVDKINKLLTYIFCSPDRLVLEDGRGSYALRARGKLVSPKEISIGERNALALGYFFVQMCSNKKVTEMYSDENLVVLDDPISSFDFENKIGILSLLRRVFGDIVGGNPKSKLLVLTHDTASLMDLLKIADDLFCNKKLYNWFKLENGKLVKQNKNEISEYKDLIKNVAEYARTKSPELELNIGNMARRVFEAYSTFLFSTGINFKSSKVIKPYLGVYSDYFESRMFRLFLNDGSHTKDLVSGLKDDMKFSAYMSSEEKVQTCKDILSLIYLLTPSHIESYVPDFKNDVSIWLDNIKKLTKI